MSRILLCFLIINLLILIPDDSKGQSEQIAWTLTTSLGYAHCLQTPLTISQSGYPDLRLNADYHTHSLRFPLYYSIKIGREQDQRRWEGELIHLKIYLRNRSKEVQQFAVSHGYNLLLVNFVWIRKQCNYRVGVGVVIGHPENQIRVQKLSQSQGIFGSGYYLTGPTVQAGLSREWMVRQRLSCLLEGKISVSYSRIPVSHGIAQTPVVALHATAGFELQYGR